MTFMENREATVGARDLGDLEKTLGWLIDHHDKEFSSAGTLFIQINKVMEIVDMTLSPEGDNLRTVWVASIHGTWSPGMNPMMEPIDMEGPLTT